MNGDKTKPMVGVAKKQAVFADIEDSLNFLDDQVSEFRRFVSQMRQGDTPPSPTSADRAEPIFFEVYSSTSNRIRENATAISELTAEIRQMVF